jgi:hypothetical protein
MVLQLAGTAVPVRQLADPATLQMSETASTRTGCSEIDIDVVQVQAPPDVGSVVHSTPPPIRQLDWY